jgi:hypothetical protein
MEVADIFTLILAGENGLDQGREFLRRKRMSDQAPACCNFGGQ